MSGKLLCLNSKATAFFIAVMSSISIELLMVFDVLSSLARVPHLKLHLGGGVNCLKYLLNIFYK